MRTRLLAIGLAAISAILVACGGGGGGGNGGPPPTAPPTATATPTPPPTPTPTPESFGCPGVAPFAAAGRKTMSVQRPIAAGDSFTYTGALNETYLQSAPCPQPTATTSASASVTVSDNATTAPDGGSASASVATETDAYPTHSSTTATKQLLQSAGGKLLLYSTSADDGTGNTITTSYDTAQELDDLGAGGTWSNDPASAIREALSDSTAISRNLASNGTYTETETYAGGSTSTVTVNADGSGVYDLDAGLRCSGEVQFAYAAPSAQQITLTITSYAANSKTGICQAATKTRTFPAWFAVPASAYVTDTFADNGAKTIPVACGVPASIGTSGTQVVETYSALDPVLGYTETRTTTSYDVPGYGPACVTIADTLDSYYDYADDTTRIDYQSENGQPNSVDTIDETLTMQTASCAGGGSGPCAQSRRVQSVKPVPASAVLGRIAAIEQHRAVQRAQRAEALHTLALHFAHQGAAR